MVIYKPDPGDIAGFELFARRQIDGALKIGDTEKVLSAFPLEVEVCGRVYTFEHIKKNEVPEGHPTGDPTIEWGVYV